MKPDQQRVCDIVMKTVMKLCKSGLEGSTARVQGVIAVTVDDSDVFVIHINDTVQNLSAPSHVYSQQDLSPVSVPSMPVSMSSPGCSSARKRARHRLVFQSPDVSRHRHGEPEPQAADGLTYNAAGPRSIDSKMEQSVCQSEPVKTASQTDLMICDMKPNCDQPLAAKLSVVVVDSDDEDDKLVVNQGTSVLSSTKHAGSEERSMSVAANTENCVDTGTGADDTVSRLCIANVVGSVLSWSPQKYNGMPLTAGTSPTVIKDDLNSYQNYYYDDDEVTVMEEEDCKVTQPWAKSTPPRCVKVTFKYAQCIIET